VTCSHWNRATNEILTGGEDRIARLFDTDGKLIAESIPCDFAVTSVAFLPAAKLCLIGTANRLYLTDNRLRPLNTITVVAGAAICASIDQPRGLVAGNGIVTLVAVIGKKIVYRDCEVFAESPRKLTVFDLKNGVSENIQFTECIVDFYLNFNNLIVATQSKVQIYKSGQWSTPVIVDTKEVARVIVQSLTMFAFIGSSAVQIIGYDGRPISRITDTRVKWDLLSADSVAISPAVLVAISPDGRKHIFAFSASTGQMITAEPFSHASEIRCVRTNQATTQSKSRFGFLNANGDLTVCRFLTTNPRIPPTIEAQKLSNFVDEFVWHSTHDLILARTHEKLTVWCAPSAVFFTAELMPNLKCDVRLLFDAAEISAFDGTHAFVIAKDGAFCVVPVSPFLIMMHEAVEVHRNWKVVLQVCRAINEQYLWAVCAACAVQAGDIDSAQEAYAALSLIDRVMFLAKVKKLKSPAAQNAMIAVLQGRVNEAEDILIQGGCIFRAVKMNISLGRWERALAVAKRSNKFLEVVAAYRTKFIKDMGIEETNQEFVKLGQVEMSKVAALVKQEKEQELA
jgi:intraflagellar transport protein 80